MNYFVPNNRRLYRLCDIAILMDLSTLPYCVTQRSYDIVHQRTFQHACDARQYRPNTQCGPAIIISGSVIWKARIYGQSATRRRHAFQHSTPTHALFDVYFAHSISSLLRRQQWRVSDGSGRREFLGGQASTAMPFSRPRPSSHSINRDVRIVKLWSASLHGVWSKIYIHRA